VNCEGLSAGLERLSHAARSELRPRRVAQASPRVSGAPARGSMLTLSPRPAARHHIAPLVCVFLLLAGPALLMRAACVMGSARSSPKQESSLSELGIVTCVMVVHCERPQLSCV